MDRKLPDVKPVYDHIVDSVIANARAHFLQDGVDESILEELKVRWAQKLDASDIFKSAEGEVDEVKEEAEGGSNPGEAEEETNGAQAAKRTSGDITAANPASKKRKTDDGVSPSESTGGASTSGAEAAAAEEGADAQKDTDAIDSDLEDDDGADDDVQNMVLAQYDKVVRNKNKWKCIMKNGIVHIDGREYVFSKATGEFVF